MKNIDNIIIGNLVEGVTLQDLGVLPSEDCIMLSETAARDLGFFLPKILVHVGLYDSVNKVKQVHAQRKQSKKLPDPDERILWRTLDKPELSRFKIGKQLFWLIVGDINTQKV